MQVYFFGCWSKLGHHIWSPDGRMQRSAGPWSGKFLDGLVPSNREQPHGMWKLTHHPTDGGSWTMLGCADQSVDTRPGANAVFVVEGTHEEPAMRAIAAQHFPRVWARIAAGPKQATEARR